MRSCLTRVAVQVACLVGESAADRDGSQLPGGYTGAKVLLVTPPIAATTTLMTARYELREEAPNVVTAFFILHADDRLDWLGNPDQFLGSLGRPLPGNTAEWLSTCVHPDDRAQLQQALSARALDASSQYQQYRALRLQDDGTYFAAQLWLSRVESASGPWQGVLLPSLQNRTWLTADAHTEVALELAGASLWRTDQATGKVAFVGAPKFVQAAKSIADGVPLSWIHYAVHPEDLATLHAANAKALTNSDVVEAMARYNVPGLGWRHVLTRRAAHRDAAGAVTGLVGISMDRTNQMQEAEASRRLRDHIELAAEAVGAGFWSCDLDTGVLVWDEQMHRLHGREAGAPLPTQGEWIEALVHPDDWSWLTPLDHQLAHQDEVSCEYRFRVRRPNGAVRWIQSWVRKRAEPGRRLMFGMQLDVTERHLADEATQRERRRTEYALQAAQVGIWERNFGQGEDYWSPEMYRLRGLSPSDPRSLDDLTQFLVGVEEANRIEAVFLHHHDDDTPAETEFKITLPDGSERWLHSQGRVVYTAQGHRVMAGVNRDVTQRKLADRLYREKHLAEEASRGKTAFMARMSHELRTPMNAVLGFAQLLLQDVQSPPNARQAERLNRIDAAARRLLAMIDNVLELVGSDADGIHAPASGMASAVHDVPPTAAGSASTVQVLCVEDNPVNLLLVKEILALRPSVQLFTAEDGTRALELIASGRIQPRLMLLDMQLPDMSGTELMLRLRSQPGLETVCYVALSANAMPADVKKAMEAGFAEYWTKPIDMPRFLADVDRLLAALR
jgi:PAS domain S-box-containing protein